MRLQIREAGIEIERGVGEITCWVAVGTEEDDIPHAMAVAWLWTSRRRRHS
jgi:hypothetical protein